MVAARTGRREEARDALRRFLASAPAGTPPADLREARRLLEEAGG
jgi:hypothetical protein